MTRKLQYSSTVDMDHKRCKYGPKTPQNYIVHPMLVPGVSYCFSYPAFKCLQYHPMPQTCVCTVIGTQKLIYEPYGNGPQTVQNRAKNTSNVHRSYHSYAHPIILYVGIIIHMHKIPTKAPKTCVWMAIGGQNPTYEPYGYWITNGANLGQKHITFSSFIPLLCTYYHIICTNLSYNCLQ